MSDSSSIPAGPILGAGIASGLEHRLQYVARLTNNAVGRNGNSWLVTTVPYLSFGTVMVDDMSREVFMVESKRGTTRFLWDPGTSQYVGQFGTRRRLAITSDGYKVTETTGASWLFFGPAALAGLVGDLKQTTGPDGTATVATYDGSQNLVSLVRTLPGTQHTASLHYTIVPSGPGAGCYSTVEKRLSRDGVTQPVKRWVYTYHPGSDGAGNLDDLKTASNEIYNAQTTEWERISTTYYRYYTADSDTGFKYGMRFSLNAEDYARMVRDGYPPENVAVAPDSLLATYATSYREYTSDKRVSAWHARGGSLVTTYVNLDSTGTGRNWKRRSIRTNADGSVATTYYNAGNQPVLKILSSTGPTSMEYSEYDDQFHPVLRCGADAIASITEPAGADQNLTVTLQADQGLIKCWQYYPMTGGGADAAPGYIQWEGVKQGSGGTLIKSYALTYSTHTAGDDSFYRVAIRTEYRSDADGGSVPDVTSYSYDWASDSLVPVQKTITLPVVSTAENGTNATYTQVERYDRFGNPVWLKDEAGVLVFHVFDPITGGLWQRITDVDTVRMDPGVVPSGWSTPTGGGFNLISDYDCDAQGRPLQDLGPLHSCDLDGTATIVRRATFRVYLDGRRQTWTSSGYTVGDGCRTLGPVSITQRNFRNQITDNIQASQASEGKISGGDRIPQSAWTQWIRNTWSDEGLLAATCAYHTIPASDREVDQSPVLGFKDEHYLETAFGYDAKDRRNKTVSPGGTITREVLDARTFVMERWIGTDDTGATDTNPAGSGGGNNMVRVLVNTFSAGQVGNLGSLLEERRPVDATSGNDTIITHSYDFRGRGVLSSVNDGSTLFLRASAYDNQDRVISGTSYHTAVADANRTGFKSTSFDAMGNAFLEQTYGVDPSTGALTYPLNTQHWYDPRGIEIKTVKPGFNGYVKLQFDTVRRATAVYQAYPLTGGLSGNSNDVSTDIVVEQSESSYDAAGNVLLVTARQRFHNIDSIGTGPLLGPAGLQPCARVTYMAKWADPVGRLCTQADYGTNGGADFTRPAVAPAASDTILVSRTSYSQDGQPAQSIAPDGVITRWHSDCLGRRTQVIDNFVADAPETDTAANRTTQSVYAPDGSLCRLIVKNIVTGDQVTRWDFGTTLADSGVARSDLLRAKMHPGDVAPDGTTLRSMSYRYDRQGRNIGTTDANGTAHVIDLDKLGRAVEDRVVTLGNSIDGAVRRISRTYDTRGLLTRLTSHNDPAVDAGSVVNEVGYEYDAFGQLTADAQSHSGTVTDTTPRVTYGYANGSANTKRRTSVTYPSGKTVSISCGYAGGLCDRLDRLKELWIEGEIGELAIFTWAGVGRFLRLQTKSQLELSYIKADDDPLGDSGDPYSGYDRFGRTVDMRWNLQTGATLSSVSRIQYGYDRAGRRLWRQDLAAPSSAGQDKAYSYDGLGQVTSAAQGNLNINHTAIGGVPASFEALGYDPIGNWQHYQRDEAGFPVLDQPRQHNQDNQLVSLDGVAAGISYDANGSMTACRPDKSGDWTKGSTLTWDAWNRLVRVNDAQTSAVIATYAYDGAYRRTTTSAASLTTDYFYDTAWKCVEERINGETTPHCLYFWSMRPGHRDELIRRDRDADGAHVLSESLYCLMDYFDPIAIADASGVVQERYAYTAFGGAVCQDATFATRTSSSFAWDYLFHGHFRDAETGWDNYGFRYYVPALGTWLSRDPLNEAGGLNLYAMASNDALNRNDYLGLIDCPPGQMKDPDCIKAAQAAKDTAYTNAATDRQTAYDIADNNNTARIAAALVIYTGGMIYCAWLAWTGPASATCAAGYTIGLAVAIAGSYIARSFEKGNADISYNGNITKANTTYSDAVKACGCVCQPLT